jgi:hypothetical protein
MFREGNSTGEEGSRAREVLPLANRPPKSSRERRGGSDSDREEAMMSEEELACEEETTCFGDASGSLGRRVRLQEASLAALRRPPAKGAWRLGCTCQSSWVLIIPGPWG